MGWGIAAVILVFLAILPLGASLSYDSAGAIVKVIVGPIRITLFPRKKKAKKLSSKQAPVSKNEEKVVERKPDSTAEAKQEPGSPKGGSWKDFLPLVRVLLDLLNRFRRKLRVNYLYLNLIMACDDPCDLGINYSRALAASSSLISALDSVLVIKKKDVQIGCDFTADKMLVVARLDLTITFGRLLALVAIAAVKGLREYFIIMKKRKAVS